MSETRETEQTAADSVQSYWEREYRRALVERDAARFECERLRVHLRKVGEGVLDDVVASCADQERLRLIAQVGRLTTERDEALDEIGAMVERENAGPF